MAEKSPILGIDFGTSKSVVAIWKDGKTEIIPDRLGSPSIPSLVMVGPDGSMYAGRDAAIHPDRYKGEHFTLSSIKRQLGKTGEVSIGQLRTLPQEISAQILGCLKLQAELYCNRKFSQAVIAVPAHYDINQRWATKQAAEAAGLEVLRLVNEASTAALAYRYSSRKQNGRLLIFDFGAGTLDVSVVDFDETVFTVRAEAGDGRLGGDDVDRIIMDFLLERAKRDIGTIGDLSPMQTLVLKETAARVKIELSSSRIAEVHLAGFFKGFNGGHSLDATLERTTLEELCKPLFDRAQATLQQALTDAEVGISGGPVITGVCMIGGSSRIPKVRQLVQETTDLPLEEGIDTSLGVAQGASILAAVLYGKIKEVLVLEVSPCTYSVAMQNDVAQPIIEKNTTIPTRRSQQFTTTQDNAKEITVRIVEGDSNVASQNNLVGNITMSGLWPLRAGVPQIEVTFDIDANGILSVTAKDKGTNREVRATMESAYRLNQGQMNWLRKKVGRNVERTRQRWQAEDEQVADDTAWREARALLGQLDAFLARQYQLDPHDASLIKGGRKVISDYLDWETPAAKMLPLLSSIRTTYFDALAGLIVNAITPAVNSAEFSQEMRRASDVERDPLSIEAYLEHFSDIFRPTIDEVVGLLDQSNTSMRAAILSQCLDSVRAIPAAALFLAMVVGRFEHEYFEMSNIEIKSPQNHLFHNILQLSYLDADVPALLRRHAAKAVFDFYHGQRCFFLTEYLIQESDDEVASRLLRCLVEIPADAWLNYYSGLDPEDRLVITNQSALQEKIREGALQSLRGSNVDSQLSALVTLEETGIGEHVPEILPFLVKDQDTTVAEKIVRLVSTTRNPQVIPHLLASVGSDSETVRRESLVALENFRDLMTPDVRRFFAEVMRLATGQDVHKSIGSRIFLAKFLAQHSELKDMFMMLKGRRTGK